MSGFGQTFAHQLTGEVDVRSVFKHQSDLTETELGDAPHFQDVGNAGEDEFQAPGDLGLDLLRRKSGSTCVHHDLSVGNIGHGVHGEGDGAVEAHNDHDQHREHNEKAVLDGKVDQPVEHGLFPYRATAVGKGALESFRL